MCLYVRDLTFSESSTLSSWVKRSKSATKMRRGQIIAFSAQGMRVQEIAIHLRMHVEYIRELIRRFNDDGFDAIKPRRRTGRPEVLTEEDRSVIAEIATAPPQAFGRPFNQWSLRKLQKFLVHDTKMIPPVSHTTIRSVLKKEKVSFQRTRTWKSSNDPDFDAKKNASRRSTGKHRKGHQ
jgi:transposase